MRIKNSHRMQWKARKVKLFCTNTDLLLQPQVPSLSSPHPQFLPLFPFLLKEVVSISKASLYSSDWCQTQEPFCFFNSWCISTL